MKVKSNKTIIKGTLLIIFLVFLDQITKYLAVVSLKDKEAFTLIPNVFELKYLENQSAAFGMDVITFLQRIFHFSYFEANPQAFLVCKMIFLVIFTIVVLFLIAMIYVRVPEKPHYRYMDAIIIGFIAGAIGNCIDRVWHHYVVDFFYFKLINFPIFNVADIYVTVAAFAMIILGIFYYKEEDFEAIFQRK